VGEIGNSPSGTAAIAAWLIVPLASWVVSRQAPELSQRWKWTRRGILCGTLALPISMLLYSLFYLVPVIGIMPGLPGLLLLMWHLLPFGGAFSELYGASLGIAPTTKVAFSLLLPTVFWSVAYGSLGVVLDARRHRGHPGDRLDAG